MSRRFCIIFAVLLIASPAAWAKDKAKARSISVTGTVETKTAPDQIVWSISLIDRHKLLREAKTSNDEKVKAVIALREPLGLAEGDLETGQVHIHREYEHDASGRNTGEFKHFVVTRHVTLRQRDLKRFDEFLKSLVTSADMDVSFRFEASNMQEIRAEARLKALKAAKDKAQALAEVVGARLGDVLTIDEHPADSGRTNFASNTAFGGNLPAADLASETFVPGAIRVQMTIYATFALK